MNNKEFGSFRLLKLKDRRGHQRIQLFCRIASPKEIRLPLLNFRKFWNLDKRTAESCRIHWKLMNAKEFGSFKFLKFKYIREVQIIQLFWRIGSPQEIRSPLFNLRKFQKLQKSTAESCKMHWNLMNEEEFGSFKFVKLKYRRGTK